MYVDSHLATNYKSPMGRMGNEQVNYPPIFSAGLMVWFMLKSIIM